MGDLIEKIRTSVIGDCCTINTPFGEKPLVYADYTASGRSLSFIEDYLQQMVLPYYANTHTEANFTGSQTTLLREQSRNIIRRAVNGDEQHKVVFCGPGATAAINKLIIILGLRNPQAWQNGKPVVFIGPYEHHSNELPWRESEADLVVIPLTECGRLNLQVLEAKLREYNDRPLKIGSFSAASNVTGIKTDTAAVARLLHKYDAYSFWDYAAAAPYVGIDMRGNADHLGDSSKDAVFISTHKFIGGPGTPGILIAKESLFTNKIPAVPGGGTVSFVNHDSHRYLDNIERREEGGTPAIVESIRAGLVFKLQQEVGTAAIESREHSLYTQVKSRWLQQPNIKILGNLDAERLSIVSFRILHQGKDLHYSFVVALLNDLFGIQARGGCSCAGPYGHSLLGINQAHSNALREQIDLGHVVLRPGWIRMNFNYFIDQASLNYLITAVEQIAQHGWKLLPYYRYDSTGTWKYQGQRMQPAADLAALSFTGADSTATATNTLPDYQRELNHAQQLLTTPPANAQTYALDLPATAMALCWFWLPQSIMAK